jgi:hypothetical protein
MASIVKTLALGGIAAFAYRAWKQFEQSRPEHATSPYVRDAGPAEQAGIDERNWDMVDQQSDESFPASDPPANY